MHRGNEGRCRRSAPLRAIYRGSVTRAAYSGGRYRRQIANYGQVHRGNTRHVQRKRTHARTIQGQRVGAADSRGR